MKTLEVAEVLRTIDYEPVPLVSQDALSLRGKELDEAIRARAREIYESRGCAPGHELDDRLRAESEYLRPVRVDVSESDCKITILAQVLGFGADELQVGVGSDHVIIAGKKRSSPEFTGTKDIYVDWSPDEIFKTVWLRCAIDPATAIARVHAGLLEVHIEKLVTACASIDDSEGSLFYRV